MNVPAILYAIALIIAIVEVFRPRGYLLLAFILVCVGLLWGPLTSLAP